MALAKQAWLHGHRVGEQAPCRSLGAGLLRRIRPAIPAKTIRPSMALADQPAGDIFVFQMKARDGAAVVVLAFRADINPPPRDTLRQCRARGLTTGLANLGRVDAMNAYLDRPPPLRRPNPQRVAISNTRDRAMPITGGLGAHASPQHQQSGASAQPVHTRRFRRRQTTA